VQKCYSRIYQVDTAKPDVIPTRSDTGKGKGAVGLSIKTAGKNLDRSDPYPENDPFEEIVDLLYFR
jgi:hypothetical protein